MKKPKRMLPDAATIRRRGGVGAVAAVAIALMGPIPQAAAADLEEGSFAGAARNYGAFAAAGVVNDLVNVRANISESVSVADSEGLSGYSGTAAGDYAVPAAIADDPESRAYSRAAPLGVGAIGVPINIVNAEAYSTTVREQDADQNDFGNLNIPFLGNLEALTGGGSTAWTDDVLMNGGVVADSWSNTGQVDLITGLDLPNLPGLPDLGALFPVASAQLGQSANEVRLVPNGDATCPSGLAVETESTWNFADVQLFGGQVGVSWGGETQGEVGRVVAHANGHPDGASFTVSEMPDMAIWIGDDAALVLEPGLSLELDELFEGTAAAPLLNLISGELSYEGLTNVQEAA
ncbi:hypothetical protein, partial [Actinocorallia glomerata]